MDHFQIWPAGSTVKKLSYADILALEIQLPWQQTAINFYLLVSSTIETKIGVWTLVGQNRTESHKLSLHQDSVAMATVR